MPIQGFIDRFKHPVLGVYTSFFIIFNYPIFIFLFSLQDATVKYNFIKGYLDGGSLRILYPVYGTLAYLLGTYLADLFLAWFKGLKLSQVSYLDGTGREWGKRKIFSERARELESQIESYRAIAATCRQYEVHLDNFCHDLCSEGSSSSINGPASNHLNNMVSLRKRTNQQIDNAVLRDNTLRVATPSPYPIK